MLKTAVSRKPGQPLYARASPAQQLPRGWPRSFHVTLGDPEGTPNHRQEVHLANVEDSWQRIRSKAKLQDLHLRYLRCNFDSVLTLAAKALT